MAYILYIRQQPFTMAQFSIMFPACIAWFIYNISTLELAIQHIALFIATLNLCYMAYDLRVMCATVALTLISIGAFYCYDPDQMITAYAAITANLALYSPSTTDLIVVANAFLIAVCVFGCCDGDDAPLQTTARVPHRSSHRNKRPFPETHSDHLRQVLLTEAYLHHKLVTANLRKKLLEVAIHSQSM
jgi:hypothetical protein